jgi:iron(III) transport system substrate-binding protein
VLNIYSHRQPFLIEPFIEAYKKQTGTDVNIVYASKGLAQRLLAEGERSPADVILTVDIARLHVYADKDLLAPVDSEVLKKNIPPHMRAPDNRWFALSKRARVIAVAREAKDTHAIETYEDLADPKWKGRICVRPGSHVYNRALVASMIDAHGMEETEKWAKGLVDNLARRPQANDRAQVKAIFEGVCDIAIINNYYYGKLLDSDNPVQREWAASVQLIFPNQDGRGTHVNISGGGVAKHSKHKEEAVRFLEFLTSETAQDLYGEINFEYPVNPAVEASETLKSWGEFKEDDMPIARIADLAPEAQRVIDRVGW